MRHLVLIAHNVRSTHNVGSLIRTSAGLDLDSIYLTGYTPYPAMANDSRLPHLRAKLDHQIHKTALGAEKLIKVHQSDDLALVIKQLKARGFMIAGLEQAKGAIKLGSFSPTNKLALVVGSEVDGLAAEDLSLCDTAVEIPMLGKKESFNVSVAAAMALYHLRFMVK